MVSRGSFDDYFEALGQRESTDNYQLVSPLGFLGKYQFGELALKEIGYYEGDGTAAHDYSGAWTGRDGIDSTAEFLAAPAIQDKAVREYTEWNWRTLTEYGLDVYAGQILDGQEMTISGILGGTWLVGFEGMSRFLWSGGFDAADDPYGTPMQEYIDLFNGYDTPFATTLRLDNAIDGGAGDDLFIGLAGNDTITGAAGEDGARYRFPAAEYTLTKSGNTLQVAHGGADGNDLLHGIEYLVFADRTVTVDDLPQGVSLGAAPGDGETPRETPGGPPVRADGDGLLRGTPFGDLLFGTAGDNVINAGGGFDTVRAKGGDDLVRGGDGGDALMGAAGADTVYGGPGADTLYGGAADDALAGGRGGDLLKGQAGADTLDGGQGRDRLVGGPGADVLTGGAGADRFLFHADDGIDTVTDFEPGHDTLVIGGATALVVAADGLGNTVLVGDGVAVTLEDITPGQLLEGDVIA
ncbi:calcium-binding protein [Acuticoccus sp. I52.16.1]|uniref:calcium-binding protein n=1 Tax=Acuticoccus sp. I52.16.1 TaxID=2928472 RepID=UPI001FD1AA03|nr:calcium-binding protein [Acuticoccus sp. I52.16.1]UOM36120.1 hypothetical protein MRB58_07965 [Acuticoccus sp. I52.16.1]